MQQSVLDRRRFSLISHGQMRFWNRLPVEGFLTVLREMPIQRTSDVLDYGCGQGEISYELVNRFDARITGVDPNAEAIARCRARVSGRFLNEEFRSERFAEASFDLIVNIGASPGMPLLLEQVLPLLRRPGRVLVGDTYWRHRPSRELLDFFGASNTQIPMLEDHHLALTRGGFAMERTLLAADADWDQYEAQYDANMLAHLKEHPDDPSFDSFESRRRAWRDMYLKHGRGTLGFALYQARVDA